MREVQVSGDPTKARLSPAIYRAALALLGWTDEGVAFHVMRLTGRPWVLPDLWAYAGGRRDLPGWVVDAILAVLLPFVEFTCGSGEIGVVLRREPADMRAVAAPDQGQAAARRALSAPPSASWEITDFVSWLDARVLFEERSKIEASVLYADYLAWCENEGVAERLSQTAFGMALGARGITRAGKNGAGRVVRRGAQLRAVTGSQHVG